MLRKKYCKIPGCITVRDFVFQYSLHLTVPAILLIVLSTGCYSLKGFNISDDLKTFFVTEFRNSAPNSPPTIQQTFSEKLKEKISRESRLSIDNENPDINFSGAITRYSVTAVAPERDATTAANRLEIAISVTYENTHEPDDQWTQTFSHFEDFPSTANLLDVQDQLIDAIFDQIIEDIFNKAFTNW